MKVEPVGIDWQPTLPVFAKESFLKAVGDEYGWLGGFSAAGEIRCILPFTIVHKSFFRMVRFRVEPISSDPGFGPAEEKDFLTSILDYFRSAGADMIIPASANAIFRAYPDGGEATPYGSYFIDLSPSEEILWKNIDRITRQNIKSASKAGVIIRTATPDEIPEAFSLIKATFRRSRLPFMDMRSFQAFLSGLGDHGRILAADLDGCVQSFCVLAHSNYCVYAIYAGNIMGLASGSNKLLYWEAMRLYKSLGVKKLDFFGARINPEKGSKQEALNLVKKRFGATLKQGYIWKCPIHPWKYRIYNLAAWLRSGGRGDIVDDERRRLNSRRAKGD